MNDETMDLRAEIAELRQRNDDLSRTLAAIERRLAPPPHDLGTTPELVERRRALRMLAGAAAVGAGASVALTAPPSVAAAPGDALVEGDNAPTTAYRVNADLADVALSVANSGGGAAISAEVAPTNGFSAPAAIKALGFQRGVDARAVTEGVYGEGLIGVRARGSSLVQGEGVGLVADGPRANARFVPGGLPPFHRRVGPAQSEAQFEGGELAVDETGAWWIAVQAGSAPHAFRMLGSPTSAGALTLIQPIRLLDSRLTKPLVSGEERVVSLSSGYLPSWLRGLHINLTVTRTVNSGYLAVYPGDGEFSGTSAVNWTSSDQDIANALPVGLGNEAIKVRCGGGHSTDFIVDVYGYYR